MMRNPNNPAINIASTAMNDPRAPRFVNAWLDVALRLLLSADPQPVSENAARERNARKKERDEQHREIPSAPSARAKKGDDDVHDQKVDCPRERWREQRNGEAAIAHDNAGQR
jgi:hypothetical protein